MARTANSSLPCWGLNINKQPITSGFLLLEIINCQEKQIKHISGFLAVFYSHIESLEALGTQTLSTSQVVQGFFFFLIRCQQLSTEKEICDFLVTSHPIHLPNTPELPFRGKPFLYCALSAGWQNRHSALQIWNLKGTLAPFRNIFPPTVWCSQRKATI